LVDGSYLAEFLLKKEYEVFGLYRRTSSDVYERIHHLRDKITMIGGDLTDSISITRAIKQTKPDEIYNMGAQSFVPASWDQSLATTNINSIGPVRILEAIKQLNPKIKFFQASSSEMFGKVQESPQVETTPFYPRSPYGISKVYAYWATVNFRESYNLHASNGISFNHECLSENTPLIIRNKLTKKIAVRRIKDIKKAKRKGKNIQQWQLNNLEIWDGTDFVDFLFLTATKRKQDEDFHCKILNTRHGLVETTNHHNILLSDKTKIKSRNIKKGDKLLHGEFPKDDNISCFSKEESMFIGMLVGDGYISAEGKSKFSNNNKDIIKIFKKLWLNVGMGTSKSRDYRTEYGKVFQTSLYGNPSYLRFIREEIYTFDGFKKIPDKILNATSKIKLAFLVGYNMCDGLKSNPCVYEFKNFKTNSVLLAQGLLFLISQTTKQDFNITFEENKKHYGYYSINLLSTTDNLVKEEKVKELSNQGLSQGSINLETGISRTFISKIQNGKHACLIHHLSKEKEEVKKILYHKNQPEWVYDIETKSGKLMAGLGTMVVSNSPRRGKQFVTRKISHSVAKIKQGYQDCLSLGNLNSKRDWGHSKDYVESFWLMLQQDRPDDYVISTGETHSVREFVEEAFKLIDMPITWEGEGTNEVGKFENKTLVKIDPKYYRPAEVDLLLGNPQKAKEKLNWEPKITFKDLVKEMVEADLKVTSTEARDR
jgi:GDPmannose 4,6-dehydratase